MITMRFTISRFFVLLCCCSLSMTAQKFQVDFGEKSEEELTELRTSDIDLTGIWEGVVTQQHWVGKPDFENPNHMTQIKITQKGDKLEGQLVCRAKFAKDMGTLSYEKDFEGKFDGQVFYYRDMKVHNYQNSHKTMRNLETCMKRAELEFYIKDGDYYLEGDWVGVGHENHGTCTPGSIRWKKVNEKEVKENKTKFEVNFESQKEKEKRAEIVLTKDKKVKKLKGRKVNLKEPKRVTVKKPFITIEVYDHKKSDGDIISLNFNGRWILENHQIDKQKHTVDLQIDDSNKGSNYLILYAHNLGGVPPNTAAIVVDDGVSRQRFTLNSDLKQSDILYFTLE